METVLQLATLIGFSILAYILGYIKGGVDGHRRFMNAMTLARMRVHPEKGMMVLMSSSVTDVLAYANYGKKPNIVRYVCLSSLYSYEYEDIPFDEALKEARNDLDSESNRQDDVRGREDRQL